VNTVMGHVRLVGVDWCELMVLMSSSWTDRLQLDILPGANRCGLWPQLVWTCW